MRPRCFIQGQKATNGAVPEDAKMDHIGLKHVTCTKSESGSAQCGGSKIAAMTPIVRTTAVAGKTQ
jgi:hypothetical protein